MKVLFWTVFFGIQIACAIKLDNSFNQAEQQRLSNVDFNELPRKIQILLLKAKKTKEDGRHFCCASNTTKPILYRRVTRISHQTIIVGTKISQGSHSCGLLNLGHCANTPTIAYRQKLVTFLQNIEVPDYQQCPEDNVVCCENYVMISHQCYAQKTVSQNLDFFKAVANGTFGEGTPFG